MQSNSVRFVLVVLGLVAACRDATPPLDGKRASEMQNPAAESFHSYDDKFIAVANQVTGFGGYYLERGKPIIVLTDTTRLSAAASAIIAIFGRLPGGAADVPRAKLGQYDFRDISRWRDMLVGNARLVPIYFVDADERANRVRIGLRSEDDAADVRTFATRNGIPLEALLVEIGPPPVFAQSYLTGQLRPIPAGASELHTTSGSAQNCTHGANVTVLSYVGHDFPGNYFLVNSHCTKYWASNDSTLFYQPLASSPYYEGYEVLDPPARPASQCSDVPYTYPCRAADVALIRAVPDSIVGLYTVAHTTFNTVGFTGTSGSIQIDSLSPNWTFTTYDGRYSELTVGYTLNKVGTSTGWTTGDVTTSCADYFTAPLNDPGAGTYRLYCQWEFDANTRGGDSSSPVFSIRSATTAAFAGILWGCHYLCSYTTGTIGHGVVFSTYDSITSDLGTIYVF